MSSPASSVPPIKPSDRRFPAIATASQSCRLPCCFRHGAPRPGSPRSADSTRPLRPQAAHRRQQVCRNRGVPIFPHSPRWACWSSAPDWSLFEPTPGGGPAHFLAVQFPAARFPATRFPFGAGRHYALASTVVDLWGGLLIHRRALVAPAERSRPSRVTAMFPSWSRVWVCLLEIGRAHV